MQVNEVAATVKAAHSALQQAMATHKAAAEVSASERKHKLEELAGDLQDLQGKMKEVEGRVAGQDAADQSGRLPGSEHDGPHRDVDEVEQREGHALRRRRQQLVQPLAKQLPVG